MVKQIQGIDDLTFDDGNLRRHTNRNLDVIEESMRRYGVNRPIVADENGRVIAGNGTLEAARGIGVTKTKVVETTGHELVVVRRTGLTPEQKAEYAVADNRAAELAEWDTVALSAAIANGLDTNGFFREDELQIMLGSDALGPDDRARMEATIAKTALTDARLSADHHIAVCPHCFHEWNIDQPASNGLPEGV